MMRTILIIQARMGSTRLPGKVLLPLGDTVVLDYVVSRCQAIEAVDDILVATSTLPQDDVIMQWCQARKIVCFRGSERDVLSRFYECAKGYAPDYVIRVTADSPFVDYELANLVVRAMKDRPSDLAEIDGNLPRGLAVELVSFRALERMHREGTEPRHREHVTYFAVDYPDKFTKTVIVAPSPICHAELRLTLDTAEDYKLCTEIARHFSGNRLVSSCEIIRTLLAHPNLAAMNAEVKQKPVQ